MRAELVEAPFDRLRAHEVHAHVSIRHNRPMAKKSKDNTVSPLITQPLGETLRRPAGPVDITSFDSAATPGFPGDKQDAGPITEALAPELGDLQERLFAVGRVEETASQKILVVLQGMDTSGKDGVIRPSI